MKCPERTPAPDIIPTPLRDQVTSTAEVNILVEDHEMGEEGTLENQSSHAGPQALVARVIPPQPGQELNPVKMVKPVATTTIAGRKYHIIIADDTCPEKEGDFP